MRLEIKSGAVFIADAHENETRRGFWRFLSSIEKGDIKPSQLFLMGDMFDLFVGGLSAHDSFAKPYVQKLESLANSMEIFYFEGNHDFRLKNEFKKVKVFSFKQQPQVFDAGEEKALLLHGDRFEKPLYKIYTFLIRSFFICALLNMTNKILNNKIYLSIVKSQKKKNICKNIDGFKQIIEQKLELYPLKNISYVLEGHYHQNKEYEIKNIKYKNFSSFACDKSYFVVQFAQGMKFTQLKLRDSNGNYI